MSNQTRASGIYETDYGNACVYRKGRKYAYDLDAGERIPVDMVDFTKFIRKIEPGDFSTYCGCDNE